MSYPTILKHNHRYSWVYAHIKIYNHTLLVPVTRKLQLSLR